MTTQDEKMIVEEFITSTNITIRHLRTDIYELEQLLRFAKKEAPKRALQIRQEIRPLAVELLYQVIGTPKTFQEALSKMEEQGDEHAN